MYSNNIVNFQESTTILNAYTKKSGNLLNAQRIFYECYFMTIDSWVEAPCQKSGKEGHETLALTLPTNLTGS